ncbi:electron transfer flavoprotein-ubiquinone oxidoreductase, partial [Xanthobacter sp. V3C-3]|uniref:NAD(P)/FAD-dependent oxidoreductase n=1 Tax=Xanthobacter lutulentifluminis TaxID=3119935 RepID=UPI00372C06AA
LSVEVTDDHFWLLGPAGGVKLPNFAMPPLMNNHGNYVGSLGNVCRFLAQKAEALGVEIYPGFAADEILYDDKGAVTGIATGDMGVDRQGEMKAEFTRGMELRGRYTVFAEGARGHLTKQIIAKYGLGEGRDVPK